jgi:hypothetical protein
MCCLREIASFLGFCDGKNTIDENIFVRISSFDKDKIDI